MFDNIYIRSISIYKDYKYTQYNTKITSTTYNLDVIEIEINEVDLLLIL